MAGFSADWLALREPVDHRSRDVSLQTKVSAYFAKQDMMADHPLRILDLGCGTGSNLRALAPALPGPQHWTLIDHDETLLQAAKAELVQWAGAAVAGLSPLTLKLDTPQNMTKQIVVDFVQDDLAHNLEHILSQQADLVTSAAFFDLVSEPWLRQFCAHLKSPFYTVLTYDGQEDWQPRAATDAEVLAAFHQHQQHDKGFGVAAGPAATDILVRELTRHAFEVHTASTPWKLTAPEDAALIKALAQGTARAVGQTKRLTEAQIEHWLQRSLMATHCNIGHADLWAIPSKS